MSMRFYLAILLGVLGLRDGWGQAIVPPKQEPNNLVVASYNIKFFKMVGQDLESLADVILNFDVCGIQELIDETEMEALRRTLENKTKKEWGYVYSCSTKDSSHSHYSEAYGVLYRRDRVKLGDGLVGNLWDSESKLRNDPYMVSFRAKNFDFVFVLLHTRFNKDDARSRDSELAAFGPLLAKKREELPEKDFILAGDFNYPGTQASMQKMASEAGLVQLDHDPKTTLGDNEYVHSYDHFYASKKTTEYVAGSCQALDVTTMLFKEITPKTLEDSKKRLSDHLPVYAVFKTDGPDDD